MKKSEIENTIKSLFKEWVREKDKNPVNKVRYAGPVLGEEEYSVMLDAIFNDWWSGGKFTLEAEQKLAAISNRNHGLLTNSGSSANLLLMAAAKELYFEDGDKILTLSCGFPTTVNPIITNRLTPVFVDIDLNDLNLSPEKLEDSLKRDKKIKGVFVAHTLGFKSKIREILDISRRYNCQVFFDCCDAYGTKYEGQPIQSYGKASSFSFYVAHHITMGEGGGLTTNDHDLFMAMRGIRNWGRYCASTNCCIRSERPELFCPKSKLTRDCGVPDDYIVNYQYEWLGYNLKPLDLQSAILTKQIDRMGEFDDTRRKNYKKLYNYFNTLDLNIKTWSIDEETSPFAFPILLGGDSKFQRKNLQDFLSRNGIETRLLFGGNLTKHPAYTKNKKYWESIGKQTNADNIMNNFLMLGVSQVNTEEHIDKVIDTLDQFWKLW